MSATQPTTLGLKCTETQTITMLTTFQSLLKTSEGGNPSKMLDMREPARQEINMEKEEARGDWLQHSGEVYKEVRSAVKL